MKTVYQEHKVQEEYLEKWQKTVDLMAKLFEVPAGLIMRVDPGQIEVLVSSHSEGNPYKRGEKADLGTGLYCETVMANRSQLQVPNALQDEDWKDNPDIKRDMISYLGIPLIWPDGKIFGTICVLDDKTRNFSELYQSLLWEFKGIIESDFRIIQQSKELKQEIAHRKQAEKELRESEQLNRTVIENSPIGISVRDKNGTLLLSNRAWQTLWGLSNSEISDYHKPRKKLVFNDKASYLSDHMDKINNVYKIGGEYYIQELKLPYTKKNTADWIAQYFYAIKDDKGNVQRVVILTEDITKRKKAEEELRTSRERLKTANSILRHDIANDIIVIDSALNIYRDEQDETMLDEIKKRVEKSLNTIQKQRDQEQFIDSHAALDEYDMEKVVHDVSKNFPDIKINVTGTGRAYADDAIYSVFENIVNNAIKHGKTTKMDIDLSSDEDHCEIRFTDYGIGIPDEMKIKIFGEGFQYGKTGHTGIGLYIVKQTVEDYDGEVSVEDNKPNGAVFVIRLKQMGKSLSH